MKKPKQLSISTAFILIGCIAVWLKWYIDQSDMIKLRKQLHVMRYLARELVVTDPSQLTAIQQESRYFGQNIWEVHIPSGQSFKMCVATTLLPDADDSKQLPPVKATYTIPAGKHIIALSESFDLSQRRVFVRLDNQLVIHTTDPKDFISRDFIGGSFIDRLTQSPIDRPLVLYKRFFGMPDRPDVGSTSNLKHADRHGAMLWIEAALPN